ncbi:MAG: hypothetical protein AABW46_04580, partial [Nanoarchaeota archaeon]
VDSDFRRNTCEGGDLTKDKPFNLCPHYKVLSDFIPSDSLGLRQHFVPVGCSIDEMCQNLLQIE